MLTIIGEHSIFKNMRVIARKTLVAAYERYPEVKEAIEAWYHEAVSATWETPAQIKEQYRSASILKGSRVVFNLCGNKYRLVVQIAYTPGIVYVRFVGSHQEYDRINAEKI